MTNNKGKPQLIRLNRYIANAGVCTRREADKLIQDGKITVNGTIVTEIGTKVKRTDNVQWDEKKLKAVRRMYLVLNKPKGFFASIKDTEHPKHVLNLVKKACRERIFPMEHPDRESTGVLIFTNDRDLTKKLTSPSFDKPKVYQVMLNKPLSKDNITQLSSSSNKSREGKMQIVRIKTDNKNPEKVGLELKYGSYKELKNIFKRLGYKVTRVDCVSFAGITKKNLKRGHWRMLTEQEVRILKFF